MALNLNTIKALFGKLAPMADDVAGAVANYGDDAARLVGEYGDDAARLVANYGDDVAEDTSRILNYVNKQSRYGAYPYHKYQSSPAIRNALTATELYDGGIPVAVIPNGGVLKKASDYVMDNVSDFDTRDKVWDGLWQAVDSAPITDYADGALRKTNFLGPANVRATDLGDVASAVPELGSISTPDISMSNVVWSDPGLIRPHKNTALGRWYDAQAKKKGVQYPFGPIGPERYNAPYVPMSDEEMDDLINYITS